MDHTHNSVGAMQLRGWAAILCLSGTQLHGVGTIAWPLLFKLAFKSPTCMIISLSSELRFACSLILWKTL